MLNGFIVMVGQGYKEGRLCSDGSWRHGIHLLEMGVRTRKLERTMLLAWKMSWEDTSFTSGVFYAAYGSSVIVDTDPDVTNGPLK